MSAFGVSAMTADGESVTKHAPPMPFYLSERMKIARLVEVLEQKMAYFYKLPDVLRKPWPFAGVTMDNLLL